MEATARPTVAADRSIRVAYVMSRFPKLTETFILDEITAVEGLGVEVEIYPLLRDRSGLVHAGAAELAARSTYLPFVSPAILASQLYFLRRRPRAYLSAVLAVVRGTWGSLRYLGGGLAIIAKSAHAARLMADNGVAHIHCHFSNHPAVAGFIAHRLVDLPYSFTAHGSDLHVDRHMLCDKVREAAFVVAISEFNRRAIVDECGPAATDKVRVIHCGVDTALFEPPPPDGERSPGEPVGGGSNAESRPLRVASIGKLHEVKGQAVLIEACRQLVQAGIDVRCELVGDGPDRSRLARQISESGLERHVVLAGSRSRAEISAWLPSIDVLAAPSVPTREGRREGIPVVLMEAMSCGRAVVASAISGIPELVEDGQTGLLVAPRDPEALAAALERLALDPGLRARLGANARAKVTAEFDLHVNATRLVGAFAEAAA